MINLLYTLLICSRPLEFLSTKTRLKWQESRRQSRSEPILAWIVEHPRIFYLIKHGCVFAVSSLCSHGHKNNESLNRALLPTLWSRRPSKVSLIMWILNVPLQQRSQTKANKDNKYFAECYVPCQRAYGGFPGVNIWRIVTAAIQTWSTNGIFGTAIEKYI